MRYCRDESVRKPYIFVTIFLSIILSMELIRGPSTRVEASGVLSTNPFYGPIICIWSLLVLSFGLLLIWQLRKFSLSAEGISVAYFKSQVKFFRWDSITEIGICNVHFSTRGGAETVFRFVIGSEFRGPSHGYGNWATQSYSIRYQYRIIIIDYSDALRQELETVCPIPIRDYRHLPTH